MWTFTCENRLFLIFALCFGELFLQLPVQNKTGRNRWQNKFDKFNLCPSFSKQNLRKKTLKKSENKQKSPHRTKITLSSNQSFYIYTNVLVSVFDTL